MSSQGRKRTRAERVDGGQGAGVAEVGRLPGSVAEPTGDFFGSLFRLLDSSNPATSLAWCADGKSFSRSLSCAVSAVMHVFCALGEAKGMGEEESAKTGGFFVFLWCVLAACLCCLHVLRACCVLPAASCLLAARCLCLLPMPACVLVGVWTVAWRA